MCNDLSKIMRSQKCTKRPASRSIKTLSFNAGLYSEALHADHDILKQVETDCGLEIWQINQPVIAIFLKGPFPRVTGSI